MHLPCQFLLHCIKRLAKLAFPAAPGFAAEFSATAYMHMK
jgi:hypothetical protein